jgi:hypothetical protein
MTPLLEVVPTADYSPSTVANEIRTHRGPFPFFLDLNHLIESQDGDLVLNMNGAIRSHGLLSIHVLTGLYDQVRLGGTRFTGLKLPNSSAIHTCLVRFRTGVHSCADLARTKISIMLLRFPE